MTYTQAQAEALAAENVALKDEVAFLKGQKQSEDPSLTPNGYPLYTDILEAKANEQRDKIEADAKAAAKTEVKAKAEESK